jgi:hypothetical protein
MEDGHDPDADPGRRSHCLRPAPAVPLCEIRVVALAVYLRDHSYGWLTILAAGLLAGISVHAFGRHIAGSSAPFAIRFCVILLFAGTAAAAGYQAGGALAELADLEPWADRGISMLIALLTGFASWRDLAPPGNGTALHA